jgi:hypothetical protein
MKHWHMALCGLFIVAGVVLVAVGADALAFLPAAGCALMMGAMMWMMIRPGGH